MPSTLCLVMAMIFSFRATPRSDRFSHLGWASIAAVSYQVYATISHLVAQFGLCFWHQFPFFTGKAESLVLNRRALNYRPLLLLSKVLWFAMRADPKSETSSTVRSPKGITNWFQRQAKHVFLPICASWFLRVGGKNWHGYS